jgi:MFS transporter, DHA2 family, multidrug resistance protein
VNSFARQSQAALLRTTGDPVLARRMSWQTLDDLRSQQASSLAYFDVFWFFAVLAAGLVLLVFIMKRSVAEKGAAVGGE